MTKIKTDILDTCVKLIGYWDFSDLSQRGKLINPETDFRNEFIEPFVHELRENLINCKSARKKRDLVKTYIHELNQASHVTERFEFIDHVEFLNEKYDFPIRYRYPDDLSSNEDQNDDYDIEHDDDDEFPRVKAHYLFALLFDEIQVYCDLYNLPFIEICDEVLVDLNVINLMDENGPRNLWKQCIQESNAIHSKFGIKPTFQVSYVIQFFEILKDFFSIDDQRELLSLLQGGDNPPNKLLFLDSGNRLADAFKQLYTCDIIRGCQKKELEQWISFNFQYLYRTNIKAFSLKYLNEIISTTKDKCQKPILDIRFDKQSNNYFISKR